MQTSLMYESYFSHNNSFIMLKSIKPSTKYDKMQAKTFLFNINIIILIKTINNYPLLSARGIP